MDGWDAALVGADVLMHTASPFPMTQPNDAETLIRPTFDGALRAMRAAQSAGVKRVILTSSVVSIIAGRPPANGTAYTAADWADVDSPLANPYAQSKTLAERDPMLPNFGFNVVDVRDVAKAHIAAMERPDIAGERLITSAGFVWVPEVAQQFKAAFPDRPIKTRIAPAILVRFLGLFDKAIKSIIPILNKEELVDGSKATAALDFSHIDPQTSLLDTSHSLIATKAS